MVVYYQNYPRSPPTLLVAIALLPLRCGQLDLLSSYISYRSRSPWPPEGSGVPGSSMIASWAAPSWGAPCIGGLAGLTRSTML